MATWLFAKAGSFVPVATLLATAATISCGCVLLLRETGRTTAPAPQAADEDAGVSAH